MTKTDPVYSQQITLQSNIGLPVLFADENTIEVGGFVGDIIEVQGKLFAYSFGKIMVYESTGNNDYVKTITLPGNEGYDKFTPLPFNTRMHVNEIQSMTYNQDAEILYVLGVDLRIFCISINTLEVTSIIARPVTTDIEHLVPLHGLAILKYDNVHKHLYCVIGGRDKLHSPATGQFHYRDVFFTIYKMDEFGAMYGQIYEELYHIGNYGSNSYDNAIMDVEFNEETFGTGLNEYSVFYLARNGKVEIYKIDNNDIVTNIDKDIDLVFYKVGKLLYINQPNGIHKIIALPYRTPTSSAEPYDPVYFCEFDGSDPTVTGWISNKKHILAPHKRIVDAAFIPNNNDLVMCFSDDDYAENQSGVNYDVAIYSYDFTAQTFKPQNDNWPQLLNTNGVSTYPNPLSLDRPLKLLVNNTDILVSKIHEIAKIEYDLGSYVVSSPIIESESNFFYKGVKVNNRFFMLNLVKNGLEVLNSDYTLNESIRIGFPVYNIASNTQAQKLYFYNKLNTHNTGIYVYDMIDEQTETFIEIESAIGDVVYNSFQNHILVSENTKTENSDAVIQVINDQNEAIVPPIQIPSVDYPKDMFVAPNGNIYIAVNMHDSNPKIVVIDAEDYSIIKTLDITNITGFTPSPDYYDIFNADFCYNPYNQSVYVIITTNNTTTHGAETGELYSSFDPYYPVLNSTLDYNQAPGFNFPGKLFEIDNTNNIPPESIHTLDGPREIICATPENTPTDYLGKLYINARNLIIYDCQTNTYVEKEKNFNDITYSSHHNSLFGFIDKAYSDNNGSVNSHRIAEVYSVDENQQIDFITTYNGQLASIFVNPYNNLLYLHTKVDKDRLGVEQVRLYEIDPDNPTPDPYSIELQNKSFYVELDKNGDFFFQNYNLTTPYIDPYQNKIYLPNGGHSNVSVVNFEARETLTLHGGENGGFTWLSVPRHLRTDPDFTPTSVVFHKDNISGDLNSLLIDYNFIDQSMVAEEDNIISASWVPDLGWGEFVSGIENVYSTRGYTVTHLPNETKTLTMYGTVENPATGIDLYCKKDNWIGYFLYEEQSVFDALADIINQVYHIKGQYFNCYRYNYPVSSECNTGGGKSATDYVPGTWICNGRPNIKYGDMIMVKPDNINTITNFQWNYAGNQPSNLLVPDVEYYTYEEKATYTTFVIELDTTTTNPTEIGAFVNDTCVGACGVTMQDSVIVLSAYLSDSPGDSVVFEEYLSSSKSSGSKIQDYLVYNTEKKRKEKRIVKTGEKQDIYIISFRPEDNETIVHNDDTGFNIYPNPVAGILNIEYYLTKPAFVNISVYDGYGRLVTTLLNTEQLEGFGSIKWDVKKNMINKGLYIIKLKMDDNVISRKVVVN